MIEKFFGIYIVLALILSLIILVLLVASGEINLFTRIDDEDDEEEEEA